jgi:hypothetical protein
VLIFLIVSVLLKDGTMWNADIPFYALEDCIAEAQAFDVFMAMNDGLWLKYQGRCEAEEDEGAFVKRSTRLYARK